jgi:hypothetical protein
MNDDRTFLWMYNNSYGELKMHIFDDVQQLNTKAKSIRLKLLQGSNDGLPIAVAKVPMDEYGSRFHALHSDGALQTELQSVGSAIKGTVIQKYIKSKGSKAWVVRAVWQDQKPAYAWVITDSNTVHTDTTSQETCTVVKSSTSTNCWPEPKQLAGKLAEALQLAHKIRLEMLAVDFLQDANGLWWMLQVKAFKLNTSTKKRQAKQQARGPMVMGDEQGRAQGQSKASNSKASNKLRSALHAGEGADLAREAAGGPQRLTFPWGQCCGDYCHQQLAKAAAAAHGEPEDNNSAKKVYFKVLLMDRFLQEDRKKENARRAKEESAKREKEEKEEKGEGVSDQNEDNGGDGANAGSPTKSRSPQRSRRGGGMDEAQADVETHQSASVRLNKHLHSLPRRDKNRQYNLVSVCGNCFGVYTERKRVHDALVEADSAVDEARKRDEKDKRVIEDKQKRSQRRKAERRKRCTEQESGNQQVSPQRDRFGIDDEDEAGEASHESSSSSGGLSSRRAPSNAAKAKLRRAKGMVARDPMDDLLDSARSNKASARSNKAGKTKGTTWRRKPQDLALHLGEDYEVKNHDGYEAANIVDREATRRLHGLAKALGEDNGEDDGEDDEDADWSDGAILGKKGAPSGKGAGQGILSFVDRVQSGAQDPYVEEEAAAVAAAVAAAAERERTELLPVTETTVINNKPQPTIRCGWGCGARLPAQALAAHEEDDCPLREVLCTFGCDAGNISAARLHEHQASCTHREVHCRLGCGLLFKAFEQGAHEAVGIGGGEDRHPCTKVHVQCQQCADTVPRGILHQHVTDECEMRIVDCAHRCGRRLICKRRSGHENSCTGSLPFVSISSLTCEKVFADDEGKEALLTQMRDSLAKGERVVLSAELRENNHSVEDCQLLLRALYMELRSGGGGPGGGGCCKDLGFVPDVLLEGGGPRGGGVAMLELTPPQETLTDQR